MITIPIHTYPLVSDTAQKGFGISLQKKGTLFADILKVVDNELPHRWNFAGPFASALSPGVHDLPLRHQDTKKTLMGEQGWASWLRAFVAKGCSACSGKNVITWPAEQQKGDLAIVFPERAAGDISQPSNLAIPVQVELTTASGERKSLPALLKLEGMDWSGVPEKATDEAKLEVSPKSYFAPPQDTGESISSEKKGKTLKHLSAQRGFRLEPVAGSPGEQVKSSWTLSLMWTAEEEVDSLKGALTEMAKNILKGEEQGTAVVVELVSPSGEKRMVPARLKSEVAEQGVLQRGRTAETRSGVNQEPRLHLTLERSTSQACGGQPEKPWEVSAQWVPQQQRQNLTAVDGLSQSPGLTIPMQVELPAASEERESMPVLLKLEAMDWPILSGKATSEAKLEVNPKTNFAPPENTGESLPPEGKREGMERVSGQRAVPVQPPGEQAKSSWMICKIRGAEEKLFSFGELSTEMAKDVLKSRGEVPPVALNLTSLSESKKAASTKLVSERSAYKVLQGGTAAQIEFEGGEQFHLSSFQRTKTHPFAKEETVLLNYPGSRVLKGVQVPSARGQPILTPETSTGIQSAVARGEEQIFFSAEQKSFSAPLFSAEDMQSQSAGSGKEKLSKITAETDSGAAVDRTDAQESFQPPFLAANVRVSRLSAISEGAFRRLSHGIRPQSALVGRTTSEMGTQINKQGLEASVISQIVQNVRILKSSTRSEIKMRLKPEQLGQVRIKLVVQNSAVSAELSVENLKVREIINANLNQLRESLLQEGIQVENFNVSVESEERFDKAEGKLPWTSDTQDGLLDPENMEKDDDSGESPWQFPPVGISLTKHLVDYTA